MWHYYVYGSPTFRCAPEHSWQSENVHARPAHCTSTMVCIGGGLLTARHARALVKIGPRCAAACLATLAICMSGLSVCSGGNYYLGIHFIAFTHLWPTARACVIANTTPANGISTLLSMSNASKMFVHVCPTSILLRLRIRLVASEIYTQTIVLPNKTVRNYYFLPGKISGLHSAHSRGERPPFHFR